MNIQRLSRNLSSDYPTKWQKLFKQFTSLSNDEELPGTTTALLAYFSSGEYMPGLVVSGFQSSLLSMFFFSMLSWEKAPALC